MDFQGLSALILSLVGVGGLVSSWVLNKRGTRNQETQQVVANRLSERAQTFDEMESLNERLTADNARKDAEIDRLHRQGNERDQISEKRLRWQADRCRTQLEGSATVIQLLQGIVLSENAKQDATEALEDVRDHIEHDHPGTET